MMVVLEDIMDRHSGGGGGNDIVQDSDLKKLGTDNSGGGRGNDGGTGGNRGQRQWWQQ